MEYFIASNLLFLLLIILKGKFAIEIMTKEDYMKWINKNVNRAFLSYDPILFLFIFAQYFVKNPYINIMIFSVCLLFLIFVYFNREKTSGEVVSFDGKKKRLIITFLILNAIPFVLFYTNFNIDKVSIYNIIIVLLIYFSYFTIYIANFINKHTIEKLVHRSKNKS